MKQLLQSIPVDLSSSNVPSVAVVGFNDHAFVVGMEQIAGVAACWCLLLSPGAGNVDSTAPASAPADATSTISEPTTTTTTATTRTSTVSRRRRDRRQDPMLLKPTGDNSSTSEAFEIDDERGDGEDEEDDDDDNNHNNSNTEALDADEEENDRNDGGDTGERINPQDIQAVALTRSSTGSLWFAVSRYNKTLSLYEYRRENDEQSTALYRKTVYMTSKRVSSLCFATVETKDIVIAADLTGDAVAYPLEIQSQTDRMGRLLLGHTASILTGIAVIDNEVLLTSDRDEKIRISCFPATYVIQGYLLGHEAFVSCFDVSDNLCMSGGGDGTIRVWDLQSMQQITCLHTVRDNDEGNPLDGDTERTSSFQLIPTRLLFKNGIGVVIYDDSLFLDIYYFQDENGTLTHSCRVTCKAQPLGICTWHNDCILVITCDPVYAELYRIERDGDQRPSVILVDDAMVSRTITANARSRVLPRSLFERDKWGNLKVAKLNETRGPMTKTKPWNNASRKDLARERNKRMRKRQRSRSRTDGLEKGIL